jgi:type IV secretory pathway VirJ component
MKMFRLVIILSIISLSSSAGFAQSTKETLSVPGNCGMCKNKIEAAAKSAGATYANWDEEAKVLSLEQKGGKAGSTAIQAAVAAAGYDTPVMKASTEAYNKLHACCKYERVAEKSDTAATTSCINQAGDHSACANCSKQMECCKDQKCQHTAANSYEGIPGQKDCCKKS